MLSGLTPDLRSPLKSRVERRMESKLLLAIAEWRMVKTGVASYESLGYGLPGGGVPEVKLREFLVIDGEVEAAWVEKARGGKRARGQGGR